MQTQMNSETLQQLRSEVEAITTLQLALNRVALTVDGDSLSQWDGPRPEDVDDVVGDDGAFSREAVLELRRKAGEALANRYTEVERVIMGRAALESLVKTALGTGTGGVITTEGPPPAQVLSALARSGAIRLDWAQEAAAQVRGVLDAKAEVPEAPKAPKSPRPNVAAAARKAKEAATAKVKAVVAGKKDKKPAPKDKAKGKASKPVAKARAAVKTVVKAAAKAVARAVKKTSDSRKAAKSAKAAKKKK